MANSKNPHKIPRRVRALFTRALAAPLPVSHIEWFGEALVTGVLPTRRITLIDYSSEEPMRFLYWFVDAINSVHYFVTSCRLKVPWRSLSTISLLRCAETYLEHHENAQPNP